MQTLEQSHKHAADLYKLAYLLTGERGASVEVTLEALDFDGDPSSFFSSWMMAWSRRVVIAKALAAIRGELAASARRTASKRGEKPDLPPRTWALDRDTSPAQLERALLAIDMFPRCVLLLSVFERMSIEDAAILLDGTPDLVRKARIFALRQLTRNLGRMQGWTSAEPESYVITGEMQHA
jgi:DNA-directed RNA polymerase specialized sigma24 family protein